MHQPGSLTGCRQPHSHALVVRHKPLQHVVWTHAYALGPLRDALLGQQIRQLEVQNHLVLHCTVPVSQPASTSILHSRIGNICPMPSMVTFATHCSKDHAQHVCTRPERNVCGIVLLICELRLGAGAIVEPHTFEPHLQQNSDLL